MNILADASLPGLEKAFPKPFRLTYYNHPDEIGALLPGQDTLLCRSTLKINSSLLEQHCIKYIATASSGTDHLDSLRLSSKNIQIIDAKGCNARSVADYVVSCVAFLEQQHLIHGNKAGIIGMGKVGSQVSARVQAADFQIFTFDPPKAEREHSFQSCTLEELFQVDLLCIHAELHHLKPYPSFNLINKKVLERLKPGCVIINAARGGIVNENDLLNSSNLIYCTDVYLNEPFVDKRIIDKALLCTPHIAGHSLEAKHAAVAIISQKLHQIAGLPAPELTPPELSHTPSLKNDASWYETVLELYNPFAETLQLKNASDKEAAFLNVRKNHQRHDFSPHYRELILNNKTKLLLG